MAIIAPSSSSSSSWCSTLLGRHQVVACSSPSMHLLKFNSISVFSSPRTPPSSSPALQLCLSFGSCGSYGGSQFASTCGNAIWRRSRSRSRRSCSSGGGVCPGSTGSIVKCRDALDALVFDCDGVILESEDLHRRAYNAAFHHFNVCCPQSPEPLVWTSEFYDELQNQIGGGKPKMRWYICFHLFHSSSFSTSQWKCHLVWNVSVIGASVAHWVRAAISESLAKSALRLHLHASLSGRFLAGFMFLLVLLLTQSSLPILVLRELFQMHSDRHHCPTLFLNLQLLQKDMECDIGQW